MFGIRKRFMTLPPLPRLIIGLPLALLFAWLTLRLQASIWVEEFADEASAEENQDASTGENDYEYDRSFFDLGGNFGAQDVSITHSMPDGQVGGVFKIDRVVFQTPGLWWLFRNSFYRASRELPDLFGVKLENPRKDTDSQTTPGNYTNLPYDAKGCVSKLLTPADLREMGVVDLKHEISVVLERASDQESIIRYSSVTPTVGRLDLELRIALARPAKFREALQDIQDAPLKSGVLKFTDLGFVAKRRAYCPGKNHVSQSEFLSYHMAEVARRFGEDGLSVNESAMAQYKAFADVGGTLEIRSTDTRKLTVGEFMAMNWIKQLQAFPAQISANGAPAAVFTIGWGGVATTVKPVSGEQSSAVATNPVVPSTAAAVASNLPAAGSVVPYEHLTALVGQHFDISTTNGTLRRGILMSASPFMLSLKIDREEGGFALSLPSDSIIEVRFTPVVANNVSGPVEGANAKTL
jgi:hypothetical protein